MSYIHNVRLNDVCSPGIVVELTFYIVCASTCISPLFTTLLFFIAVLHHSMFPLLDLPEDALNNVLKTMDKLSLMLLSIFSERMGTLVKWLKLELNHLIVDLEERVFLNLKFKDGDEIEIYLDHNGYSYDLGMLLSDIIVVRSLTEFEYQEDIYFNSDFPNVRHWIDYFHNIFSYRYVDLSFFELRTLCYSFESIVKTLKGIPIQVLQAADIYEVFTRVLHYFPIARLLHLRDRKLEDPHPAPRSEFMAKLLIQNFDAVYFHSSIPVTFNSLLIMNTPFLWARAPKQPDRELNMFIRFWMNNPTSKLECLALGYKPFDPVEPRPFRVFHKNVIFKGIDYIERPRDLVRYFECSINFHPYHGKYLRLPGGYDITRRDGTKCTIKINMEIPSFEMYVWP